MSQTQTNSRPIYQKRLPAGISASIFQNERDGRTYRSVNIQRSYRKNGNWQRNSIYLSHEQIPFMIEALKSAWDVLNGDIPLSQAGEDQVASEETAPADAAA